MTRWKAIGWTVAFFASGFAMTLVAMMLLHRSGLGLPMLWMQVLAQIVGFLAATWLIGPRVLKWDLADLRWRTTGNGGKGFALGLLIGMIPAVVAMAIAIPAGGAGWSLDGGSFLDWLGAMGPLTLLLVPAAFSEELIFRGAGYLILSRRFGRVWPAVALSVLFGAAHLGNPNVTGLGLVNVALAGMFLSAALWLPGGIWAATGVHLGWNLTLAALGAPVSGLAFTLPMLDYATGGPSWLTGSTFGPEGGVIATVIVGAGAVLLFRRTRYQEPSTPEAA